MNAHLVAALLVAAASSPVAAEERTALALFSADQVKSAYLACDSAAAGGLLTAGDAAHCSTIYEELKERVFEGDFARLLAWWAAQRRLNALTAR